MKNNKIKVVELFAGVGGFRIGLEGFNGKSASTQYTKEIKSNFEVVWSNQWEPSTKTQHANMVYESRFGKDNHCGEDINEVVTKKIEIIEDHDLLVGGFPCQDYSVATTLHNSKGLKGKKGVLWWAIHKILESKRPKYLFLENVDRLLKSPAKQRGRDFAVMLQSLNELGYVVEWRVINAAEFGMPQRRRRVFFIGYHKSTGIYNRIKSSDKTQWLSEIGTIAKAFPVSEIKTLEEVELKGDLVEITNEFNKKGKLSPFHNTGLLIDGKVHTAKTTPKFNGNKTVLKDVLIDGDATDEFYIKDKPLKTQKSITNSDGTETTLQTEKQMWEYLKGSKKEKRTTKEGYEYSYSEGGMIYPDALDNASRTIITGEGGKSPSRFKHVIETDRGLRRLTPIELERLNMFPNDHTKLDGITDNKRAFFMGNALVVGIVEKIGIELCNQIRQDESI